jgi:hypothetical protein
VLGVFHASFADAVAPTAALNASNVTAGGGVYYWFQVAYSDNASVSWSTIGSGDVEVSGPNGFVQSGVLSNLTTSGGVWTATYRITAPGGTFDAEDNGTYTVAMRANEVADTSGKFVPAGTLGTFAVRFADATPPTAALTATDVTTAGGVNYWFRVAYSDNAGIASNTIDGNDVEVSGPGGYLQSAALSNVSFASGVWTVTYRVTAPGGTFGAEDNGTYTVTMKPSQVADTSGNFVAAGSLGTFQVAVPAPPAAAQPVSVASSSPFSGSAITVRRGPTARSSYGLSDLLA